MHPRPKILAATALVLLLGLAAAEIWASVTDGVSPAVISGGGGRLFDGGGSAAVEGTIGQPVVGVTAGGSLEIHAGFWTVSPVFTSVGDEVPDAVDRLHPAYPNPFNPATTVRFTLARSGPVRVAIYDVRGRLVQRLVDAHLPAGAHERTWRGTDLAGDAVASGIYVLRLQTDQGHVHQKLTLLK